MIIAIQTWWGRGLAFAVTFFGSNLAFGALYAVSEAMDYDDADFPDLGALSAVHRWSMSQLDAWA